MKLKFKGWLLKEEAASSLLTPNPTKQNDPKFDFLVVLNAKEVYQVLKKHGFRFYKPDLSWSIPRFAYEKLPEQAKNELKSIGIDVGLFDLDRQTAFSQGQTKKAQVAVEKEKQIQQAQSDAENRKTLDYSGSKVDQIIKSELEAVKELSKKEDNEKIERMLDTIIHQVANMVDEAKKSKIIKDFMAMAARLYQYSARNQWLIYAQNPEASDVQSKTKWNELGRQVTPEGEKNAMIIFRPVGVRQKIVKSKELDRDTGEEKEVKRKVQFGMPKSYTIEYVYDISDTVEKPGSKSIYKPHSWRQDSNEPVEELGGIISGLLKYAKENEIPVDFKKLNFGLGGYATKHGITINSEFEGINKASTIIHEMAHKMMHFVEKKTDITRSEAEHDAETVAYTVLKFFGFESKDSPVYLSLWGGTKEKIKLRAKGIKETVSLLIRAIQEYYKLAGIQQPT
jgi:hypothetical protein